MIALETKTLRAQANRRRRAALATSILWGFIGLTMVKHAQAQSVDAPHPKMAAIDQYLMTQGAEVALARSAAPESISKDADVLVLDRQGYQTASKGRNGFACMVQRSWSAGLDDLEFWNPKLRAPICLNPPAVRSYLPLNIKRTKLVLAGNSKEQLSVGMKAAFEAKELRAIEPGAIGYMLSKQAYLSDRDGHWHPHIMTFVPQAKPAEWDANLRGSPVFGYSDAVDRVSVFMIPVRNWSDGSADCNDGGSH
jgi:hypothetical protein